MAEKIRYFELVEEHSDAPGEPLNSLAFWVADKELRLERGQVLAIDPEPKVGEGEDPHAAREFVRRELELLAADPHVREIPKPKAAKGDD